MKKDAGSQSEEDISLFAGIWKTRGNLNCFMMMMMMMMMVMVMVMVMVMMMMVMMVVTVVIVVMTMVRACWLGTFLDILKPKSRICGPWCMACSLKL